MLISRRKENITPTNIIVLVPLRIRNTFLNTLPAINWLLFSFFETKSTVLVPIISVIHLTRKFAIVSGTSLKMFQLKTLSSLWDMASNTITRYHSFVFKKHWTAASFICLVPAVHGWTSQIQLIIFPLFSQQPIGWCNVKHWFSLADFGQEWMLKRCFEHVSKMNHDLLYHPLPNFSFCITFSSWWFQPIWKNAS